MRPKYFATQEIKIESYVHSLLKLDEDEALNYILKEAKKYGTPPLHVTQIDGRHIEVLAKMISPKKIVEIGTLCGVSALHLCRALGEDGKLWTIEKSEHHHFIAQEIFKKIEIKNQIEFVLGSAEDVLQKIEENGPFDIVFIDANKDSYPSYFQWAKKNLRPGGLLIADNVFLFGYIAEDKCENEGLEKLRIGMQEFNEMVVSSKEFLTTFLPTGEGLLVAIKKEN